MRKCGEELCSKSQSPDVFYQFKLPSDYIQLLGSFIIALSYIILDFHNFNIVLLMLITVLGFIGCQVDSLLGALFETRGKMSKGHGPDHDRSQR